MNKSGKKPIDKREGIKKSMSTVDRRAGPKGQRGKERPASGRGGRQVETRAADTGVLAGTTRQPLRQRRGAGAESAAIP